MPYEPKKSYNFLRDLAAISGSLKIIKTIAHIIGDKSNFLQDVVLYLIQIQNKTLCFQFISKI